MSLGLGYKNDQNHARASTSPHLSEAVQSWFRLACISFGGTATHIAIMHDDFVERNGGSAMRISFMR
jgi:chromate transport protein ChrA